VQRFPAGHRLAVVLAASDTGYRGNLLPADVTVTTSAAAPGVLELPVLGAAAAPARPVPGRPAAAPAPAAPEPATGSLPATGGTPMLPLAALLLLSGAVAARRRRTAV
jgi:LPXTG-motif cell wall-anchored protein